MDRTRRNFLQGAAIFGAGVLGTRVVAGQNGEQNEHGKMQMPPGMHVNHDKMQMHKNGAAFLPVVTPDVADLPFEMDNGVKVFHLVAEPVKREIIRGKVVNLWGYNGSAPGQPFR